MKITIHTPSVLVEEFDEPLLDDPAAGADDDGNVIALTRNHFPINSYREDGDPVVFSRGGDDVLEAAERFTKARRAYEKARDEARVAAVKAADAGVISEHALAKLLGVDRLTIRSWRGKGR